MTRGWGVYIFGTMRKDKILAQLEEAEQQLLAELSALPQFRQLKDIRRLIESRRAFLNASAATGKPIGSRPTPRSGSNAAKVVALAQTYLKEKGRRATSAEIHEFLRRQGVDVKETASVAAYLSTAKDIFDNVRGQGYGLVEWQNKSGTLADEAPQGTNAPVRSETADFDSSIASDQDEGSVV